MELKKSDLIYECDKSKYNENLKEIDFFRGYEKQIVVCLGMFDSVHIGHRKIISKTQAVAKNKGCECFVFTFKNNYFPLLGSEEKLVFTYSERLSRFSEIGVDGVIFANADENFLNTDAGKFLNDLTTKFKIGAIVCGNDYTFGKNGVGNAELLAEYCRNKGIEVFVCDLLEDNGEKISSSSIRNAIKNGEMDKVKKLLGGNFYLQGEVVIGRQDGRKLGFPTANIEFPPDKLPPRSGVYVSRTFYCGKVFKSMTNVGTQPTFDDDKFISETNVFGIDCDFYGEILKVEFLERIRDVKRFFSLSELSKQLAADRKYAQRFEEKEQDKGVRND